MKPCHHAWSQFLDNPNEFLHFAIIDNDLPSHDSTGVAGLCDVVLIDNTQFVCDDVALLKCHDSRPPICRLYRRGKINSEQSGP